MGIGKAVLATAGTFVLCVGFIALLRADVMIGMALGLAGGMMIGFAISPKGLTAKWIRAHEWQVYAIGLAIAGVLALIVVIT